MLRKLSLPLGLAAALIFAAPAPALANPFKDHGRAIKDGAKSDSGALKVHLQRALAKVVE